MYHSLLLSAMHSVRVTKKVLVFQWHLITWVMGGVRAYTVDPRYSESMGLEGAWIEMF